MCPNARQIWVEISWSQKESGKNLGIIIETVASLKCKQFTHFTTLHSSSHCHSRPYYAFPLDLLIHPQSNRTPPNETGISLHFGYVDETKFSYFIWSDKLQTGIQTEPCYNIISFIITSCKQR